MLNIADKTSHVAIKENPAYLSEQLITYIGNKRVLLDFIGEGLKSIQKRLGKNRFSSFDVFSGSGIVSRYLKKYSNLIIANDLENYSKIINSCYLTNHSNFDAKLFDFWHENFLSQLTEDKLLEGVFSKNYSPKDINNVKKNERCFFTPRNARYIDTARTLIDKAPKEIRHFFLAPLLSEVSIHANTSGVFKGFYKNSKTGCGQFGGNKKDSLTRILGNIELKKPVFSNFESDVKIYTCDANQLIYDLNEVDLAYLDPPYNQHPYGSNYFMLNLILENKLPNEISKVSGIPKNWKRSNYNIRRKSYSTFKQLVKNIKAKFLIISFNSEGFISLNEMLSLLEKIGKVEVLETKYNTFRGSRNLQNRPTYVKEYLYLVEKF